MSSTTARHADTDEAIITNEITRCILGGPERVELRTDITGRLANAIRVIVRDLAPVFQKFDRAISEAGRKMADLAEQYANNEGDETK